MKKLVYLFIFFFISSITSAQIGVRTFAVDAKGDTIFTYPATDAEPKLGLPDLYLHITEYIMNNYSDEALDKKLTGQVQVSFVVRKDGSISDVGIEKSLCAGCDAMAIQAVETYKGEWKVGTYRQRPVHHKLTVPVNYRDSSTIEEAKPKEEEKGEKKKKKK